MSQVNNMPAVIPSAMQNLIMTPPAELMAQLAGNFQGAYEDFGGMFRSISFKWITGIYRRSYSGTGLYAVC